MAIVAGQVQRALNLIGEKLDEIRKGLQLPPVAARQHRANFGCSVCYLRCPKADTAAMPRHGRSSGFLPVRLRLGLPVIRRSGTECLGAARPISLPAGAQWRCVRFP